MDNQPNNSFKSKNNGPKLGKKPPSTYGRGPMRYLGIILIVILALTLFQGDLTNKKIRWDEFEDRLDAGKIDTIKIGETDINGKCKPMQNEDGQVVTENFRVEYQDPILTDDFFKKLNEKGVKYEYAPQHMYFQMFIAYVLPVLILVAVFYFFIGRNMRGGAGGMLMSFGRSRHRLQAKDKVKVTFKDVAGIEEAKDEVGEIIEFLKNPKKFQRLGGRIPRGVLLVGPPGCGKTLLAKAIAGEADVPFFSISGSDFVEMFVGVGASRVRDLFKSAKDNSPCIIFLDEIDAIGRKRGASFVGGGHDEREQTLNAILVEMDGFDTNDQVIVIAATNRGDILDHALTRPGRFDRQVIVPLPDVKGRHEILKVHAKKVKLAPEANLERVARGTPMFSGADLAAIINEAALAATMANKDAIELDDLEEARDKVRWGRAKRSRAIDQKEKEVTAYHEAGHTVVQCLVKDADPLHKVSIIPRGPMGGATFSLPEKDRTMFTRNYCLALLQICYGGRIAEELFCGDISSGASGDIEQATGIAKQMILTWGMSEQLGPVLYGMDISYKDPSYIMPTEKDYSEKTAQDIDNEIKRLTGDAYRKSRELLEAHRNDVENIAKALLKYETLDAEEVKTLLNGGILNKPTVGDLLAAEQAKPDSPADTGPTILDENA